MQQLLIRNPALWASSALLLGACQSLSVRSDTAATVSVSTCGTYAWTESAMAERRNAAFENPINHQRVKSAISQRLESHGIHPGQLGSADCLISYATGTRITRDEHRSRFNFGIGTGYGWGHSNFGSMFWNTGVPNDYRESRLSVDLYKATTKEPIWHASVNADISQLTGANAEKRIDSAISAMFAKFPATPR